MPVAGKPLIQWTLDAARHARCLARVAVSSDDDEILALAHAHKVESLRRPPALAADIASPAMVAQHALHHYAAQGITFDAIMVLPPTAPLRTAEDIRAAAALFAGSGAASVASVSPTPWPAHHWVTLGDDVSLDAMIDAAAAQPAAPEIARVAYHCVNGAIYLVSTRAFEESLSLLAKPARAYVMPPQRGHCIDTQDDVALCEMLLNAAQIATS